VAKIRIIDGVTYVDGYQVIPKPEEESFFDFESKRLLRELEETPMAGYGGALYDSSDRKVADLNDWRITTMQPTTNITSTVKITGQPTFIDWYGTEQHQLYHVLHPGRVDWLKQGDVVFRQGQQCFYLRGDRFESRTAYAGNIDTAKLRPFIEGDKVEIDFK